MGAVAGEALDLVVARYRAGGAASIVGVYVCPGDRYQWIIGAEVCPISGVVYVLRTRGITELEVRWMPEPGGAVPYCALICAVVKFSMASTAPV